MQEGFSVLLDEGWQLAASTPGLDHLFAEESARLDQESARAHCGIADLELEGPTRGRVLAQAGEDRLQGAAYDPLGDRSRGVVAAGAPPGRGGLKHELAEAGAVAQRRSLPAEGGNGIG